MTATIHSATAATKPGLACVTRTPCALAAATSTVRMSTAQRMKANSSRQLAEQRLRPGVCR